MNLGADIVDTFKLGATQVDKIMLGADEVWGGTPSCDLCSGNELPDPCLDTDSWIAYAGNGNVSYEESGYSLNVEGGSVGERFCQISHASLEGAEAFQDVDIAIDIGDTILSEVNQLRVRVEATLLYLEVTFSITPEDGIIRTTLIQPTVSSYEYEIIYLNSDVGFFRARIEGISLCPVLGII